MRAERLDYGLEIIVVQEQRCPILSIFVVEDAPHRDPHHSADLLHDEPPPSAERNDRRIAQITRPTPRIRFR